MSCQLLNLKGACQDFEIAYNYDLNFSVALIDVVGGTKTPRNISGYTIEMNIKEAKGATAIETIVATIATGTDGIAEFTLLNANIIANFTESTTYYYDITQNDGTLTIPLYNGKITFQYV